MPGVFSSGSTLSINSPIWKSLHRDQEELIWPSFLGKVRKNTDHSFRDIFDILVGKVNQ